MSNLNYKCLGGDLLVFKNLNDCMTISTPSNGIPYISRIESMKEDSNDNEWRRYNSHNLPWNPFTEKEMEYWLKEYKNTDAGKC